MPTDERTPEAIMTAPAGQALLALVEGLDLSPGDLADPLTAFHVATGAMGMVSPWDPTTAARLERLAADTPARRSTAERIARATELAWWWGPLDRNTQIWSSHAGSDRIEPGLDRASMGPLSGFERYAHKPHPSILTSTAIDGISSLVIATAVGNNDLRPHTGDKIRRRRLPVRSDARVYEVTGPAAWAALARRYPAIAPAGHTYPEDRQEIVPDWPAVAHDWDGVHVPLGAMLLATDVWVTDTAGTSRFWAWEAESTYWLRWSFDQATPLPDLPFDAVPEDPSQERYGDVYRRPVLDSLLRPDLLMAGDGPAAIALRSSTAVSFFGPPMSEP